MILDIDSTQCDFCLCSFLLERFLCPMSKRAFRQHVFQLNLGWPSSFSSGEFLTQTLGKAFKIIFRPKTFKHLSNHLMIWDVPTYQPADLLAGYNLRGAYLTYQPTCRI